ncbi:ribosome assembly factor SBDS [archaeon]|nr:ribosome assembly factor SBDS [archaeon]
MIPLDKAVIARLDRQGHHFEIYVDPEKSWEIREGKDLNIDEILASDEIYKDTSKAEKASEEVMKESFGTLDYREISKIIIQKGEIQLTTDQRKKLQEEKRKQIIDMIARGAIDPRTNAPHPPARIERAMEEAKVHVDPFKSTERQVESTVDALREKLPIKFAKARIAIKIPSEYAGKAAGYMHQLKKTREEWGNDGSYLAVIEIPAGQQSQVYDKLNSVTHGQVETKLLETI